MTPIDNPIPEPDDFDTKCRQKGNEWLIKNPECKRPKDYWGIFRGELAAAFKERCAYGALRIGQGTVDHHVSCHEDNKLAYEWSNYRYVDGWMNSSKNKKPSSCFLDPFEVEDGWFEIELPSLQMTTTTKIPAKFRERAEYTLNELPLKNDERIIRQRRAWLKEYEEGNITIQGLYKFAPLIAKALENSDQSN